uniref:Uncharacterized protein n=1 Tax=Candidatus Kentrum eta TaxID=2126337 RepID=A0A450UXR4_9GAMM|nr:MAG: hypothetical protein BECKH772B_GA0070898_101083 [Candidatus Kentron sp. H]VFJ97293.1 MAG: hypothetical protein BECKH772A_GA0070896_101183 [Candidatus Kentron sp. H]VFK02867.1 MAG: hypothetical protein BECKH772C_GA0070978_101063 [Candidatus Kentron sp. H]
MSDKFQTLTLPGSEASGGIVATRHVATAFDLFRPLSIAMAIASGTVKGRSHANTDLEWPINPTK